MVEGAREGWKPGSRRGSRGSLHIIAPRIQTKKERLVRCKRAYAETETGPLYGRVQGESRPRNAQRGKDGGAIGSRIRGASSSALSLARPGVSRLAQPL